MRILSTRDDAYPAFLDALRDRNEAVHMEVKERVEAILRDVQDNGTAALRRWARDLDGMPLDVASCEVSSSERQKALERLAPEDQEALKTAAHRIRAFHERPAQKSWLMVDGEGILLGQMVQPLECAGIYVPGGRAVYPSSVLMCAIPARVAGVQEIVMCCPLSWTAPNSPVLAAAEIAGVDRVFRLGGAQAIAAMAYGIGEVPRVDKIVGPGNAFVTSAKRLLYGTVDIDMVAGPSEILVIADGSVQAKWAAADLLSQAEHDEWASAILLTPSEHYARQVDQEVSLQLSDSDRRGIAEASLQRFGGILMTKDLDEALEVASQIAPEHVEMLVDRPLEHIHRIRHAGAAFLGPWSPEAMGDYLAGPNHVLPSGGTARFSSPLGVEDFLKRTHIIELSERALTQLGPQALRLASMEGLSAHARSVEVRLNAKR